MVLGYSEVPRETGLIDFESDANSPGMHNLLCGSSWQRVSL